MKNPPPPIAKRSSPPTEVPYAAPALDKGIDILETLGAVDHPHGLSKAEIAQRLGRSISEVFRMIVTLERRGWVEVDGADRYHLSLRLFELAHRHHRARTLTEAATPLMQTLTRAVRQSCHLSIAERGRIIVIAQVNAPGNINFSLRIGAALGLFNTASGQILLAFSDEAQRQQMIVEHSLLIDETNPPKRALFEQLNAVRAAGYTLFPSQQVRGATNIGCPIFSRNGVEAALVTPYLELIGAHGGPLPNEVLAQQLAIAGEISLQLGHIPKPTQSG